MYCKHCGNEIPDDARFCNKCGKEQNNITAQSEFSVTLQTDTLARSVITFGPIITIVLSAMIIISSLLPWVAIRDSEYHVIHIFHGAYNLFSTIGLYADVGAVSTFLLVSGGIISLLAHGYAVYIACTASSNRYSMFFKAAIITILYAILALILNAVVKYRWESEIDGSSRYLQAGAGIYVCLIVSIIQYACCYVFTQHETVTELNDGNIVICPHCGTSYLKRTSATTCPKCHKLPGDLPESPNATVSCPYCKREYPWNTIYCDYCKKQFRSESAVPKVVPKPQPNPEPKPVSNTVICPFCKRVYPAGTIYCEGCNAQIGAKS